MGSKFGGSAAQLGVSCSFSSFGGWRGGHVRGKTGLICHFAFSPVLQCLGVPKMLGKTARRVSLSDPFLCAPSTSKTKDLRTMSPYASRQSTGKMINRPHFAHIQGGCFI